MPKFEHDHNSLKCLFYRMRKGSNLIQAITKNSQRVVSTTTASKQSTKVLTIDEVTTQTVRYINRVLN